MSTIRPPMTNAAGFPTAGGLYDPRNERDSCGTGFVARLDGKPSHAVVQDAVRILINLEHRGAIGGDASTGDGAGIMVAPPDDFFRNKLKDTTFDLPPKGQYAVGFVFLPTDPRLSVECVRVIEHTIADEGCDCLGWRDVPTDDSTLGSLAKSTMPLFRQVFIQRPACSAEGFERRLYVIRRLIEKRVSALHADVSQFYICSLSAKRLVYKGMLTGVQLSTFYPDLSDPLFAGAFAIVHQRFSTNTLPTWPLAQPFRFVAHNGEINTLRGNINRMRGREAGLKGNMFGPNGVEKIKPALVETGSDSAIFDNMLEMLVLGGRSLPHALMMLIPEAWGGKYQMSEDKRAFYEYHAAMMEPWDGPAAMVVTDGRYIGATLDRNGLRPARWTETTDGVVILASETGVLNIPPERILQRGRLSPGKMLLVDLEENRLVPDREIKSRISRQKPYRKWLRDNRIELRGLFAPSAIEPEDPQRLQRLQALFGYTREDLKTIIGPMARHAQEPVGSMGDDTAHAVLSDQPRLLFDYFKQLFAQVTNPPIDPYREGLVMSLTTFVGPERNLLEETPEHCRMLKLTQPVLTPQDMDKLRAFDEIKTRDIDILFDVADGAAGMERALKSVFLQVEQAIRDGVTLAILTDKNVSESRAPIPSLLAVSGVNNYLTRGGHRANIGVVIETGEAREVMHFALLIGFGCLAISPYLALQTVRNLAETGQLDEPFRPGVAADNYVTAINKGLLKTFSRMGISTIRSYFSAQIFECLGLNREVVDEYFTDTPSRIGGIGLEQIAQEALMRHGCRQIEIGGKYQSRLNSEKHLYSAAMIRLLQRAVRNDDVNAWNEYASIVNNGVRGVGVTLRSLLAFASDRVAVPLDEVESADLIMKRFVSGAMSLGSISRETHETIAIAMNRVGAKSNSGEGGEDPRRNKPLPNGDSLRSEIKQVASGRFGVTTEYLVNARELQIKMAQGAKPGEGGQLPGHKVSREIATVRHTTPGVTLISPPPHHDIYSIEDLAQLIHDLKSVNPGNDVSVKLVSECGVGTIAAGVAKAKADIVLISGGDGGTGASPLTSIKHAGLPWELGLAEAQQTLVRNRLRDRIRVQVDGQLRTGRDIVIGALLGAEEFGFGSIMLVSLGCIMARKCHLNTCPVGVATQDPRLRKLFAGKPEHAVRFLRFIAEDTRRVLASLGYRSLDEIVGRADLLKKADGIIHWKASTIDFSAILNTSHFSPNVPLRRTEKRVHSIEGSLDEQLLVIAKPALETKTPVSASLAIRNVHRTVGTTLSGEIARRYGAVGLPDDTIKLSFKGSAGQSFGAFLSPGITMTLEGDANDYLGKGMSGGRIIVRPPEGALFLPHENVIAGNTVLYGATGGEAFIRGMAGERFAVRNSGATAVVEGIGDHGCEYMTGGTVVVLGPIGVNFAAGMSGGFAYIYSPEFFETRFNLDMVDLESVHTKEDEARLRHLLEKHFELTGSDRAEMILDRWESRMPLFIKVMPIEYRRSLERLRIEEAIGSDSLAATEEVFKD